MSRRLTALVVAVGIATVAAPISGVVVISGATPTSTPGANGTTVMPGDQLQGVVGVHGAEIEGDIEERAFAVAFTSAETNASRATAVGEQVSDLRERLRRLEREKGQLRAARENETIDGSEFRARMAILAAEAGSARRIANETANATRQLPDAALQSQNVDRASVRGLGRRASNLTGPQVAAIARSVAGRGVGKRIAARNRPNVTGPPVGVPGNGPPGNDTGPPDDDNDTGPPDDPGPLDVGTAQVHPPAATGVGPASLLSDRDPGHGTLDAGHASGFGWSGSFAGPPEPAATTRSGEGVPLFSVDLQSTGPANVTLQLTFDLSTDADQRAFRTLQDDEEARADVRTRFQSRMQSVANSSERRVDRDMRVTDSAISLSTTADGETGVVTLSVVWENLAGRSAAARPNLVITEPFASGFTPSRQFTVRIVAPEDYRLTRVSPDPRDETNRSASWAAGTSLDGFTLEFAPPTGTPLPDDAIEDFQPTSPTAGPGSGGGPSLATLAVGGLMAIAVAIGGFLAWRRREAEG